MGNKNRFSKNIRMIKASACLLLVAVAFSTSARAENQPPEAPTGLLLDLMHNPLGVENPNPRFSWIVNDPDSNESQTACQILVADDPGPLDEGRGNVWDSARIETSESSNVLYRGPALKPNRVYYWKVRTWDKAGQAGPYSAPQILATAVGENWKAIPIWAGATEAPHFALLRRNFKLEDKPVSRAIVHVTAVSPVPAAQYVYKLYLNGRFVGMGPERGFNGAHRYNSFDVTEQLRTGQANALAAINYSAHDDRSFLLQLSVDYADGSRQMIATDESWKALPADNIYRDLGNAGHPSYYYAPREGIDARHYPFGWKRADFDDSGWARAGERKALQGLTASATGNTESYTGQPETFVKKGDGHYFIDFGRSALAGIRLKVSGKDGHKVEIQVGEELAGLENIRKMRTGNTYEEVWTLKEGDQVLENFGYRVFRYAEVRNAPEGFDASSIETIVYRHPFDDEASQFSSSDPVLNAVWEFCKYSIKATSLDVYVDTHTRERRNYEGDALINQLSHYAVDREFALPRYSIEYLYYIPTWPTEYKLQSVMMAWYDYLHTGNPDSLREHYEVIKIKTLEPFINDQYLVEKKPKQGGRYGRDLVDWPHSQRDGYDFTTINTVINAFNYKAIRNLGNIAYILGKTEDARRYQKLAANLKEAINRHLYDPETGAYKDGRDSDHFAQHASAFPLALGLVPEAREDPVADYLADRGMSVSVYGSQFLLDALYAADRPEAALKLMNAKDGNSWGHMLYDLNATIVGEAWDPSQKGNMSFSHAWASAPANVVPRGLFGVHPLTPGFEHFQIKPQPTGLDWASITVPSIKGPIEVAFKRHENALELTVDIPANTTATVYVPLEGLVDALVRWNDRSVKGTIEGDYLIVPNVGSGQHRFVRM